MTSARFAATSCHVRSAMFRSYSTSRLPKCCSALTSKVCSNRQACARSRVASCETSMMPASSAIRSMETSQSSPYAGKGTRASCCEAGAGAAASGKAGRRSARTNRAEPVTFVIPFAAIQAARLLTNGFIFGLVGRDQPLMGDMWNMI